MQMVYSKRPEPVLAPCASRGADRAQHAVRHWQARAGGITPTSNSYSISDATLACVPLDVVRTTAVTAGAQYSLRTAMSDHTQYATGALPLECLCTGVSY